ncbi:MAG TPA: putative porin [Pyrinomonadaceae bacterium]|jgi:hypothetical protein|nr:putative porin [Pyrinomonadaceae bacterium]
MLQKISRSLLLCALLVSLTFADALAQANEPRPKTDATPAPASSQTAPNASGQTPINLSDLVEVHVQLRNQQQEIERLRHAVQQQMRLIDELRVRLERTETSATTATTATNAAAPSAVFKDALPPARDGGAVKDPAAVTHTQADTQASKPDERLGRVEEQLKKTSEVVSKQLGSLSFSGDIRLRYESFYGQLNSLANADNPAIVGNPLSTRQRLRLRARLGIRGQVSKEFDWGLRLATGTFPDVISSNQTLTDFFSHKNFSLEQAYVNYRPAFAPGLQIQGGKFEAPWLRTEMTFDNDINPEGLNESYTRAFKNSTLKNLTLVAWQLPFLERSSAFVLDSAGRIDFDQSRRAGRDLALYGAQVRARLEPSKNVALTLSAADLFYSGTQFITPAQFFGANVQIPVTVRIPATATTPAQTVVAQVSIPRDQLVSGNANLGVSIASNNATNRDGRLASGFNLVDLIGRLDLSHSKRWPVMLLFNFVTNTQARDIVAAGAGGANVLQANNENNGYWAEAQIGKTQQRGDWLFNYAFIRIEKDAVLTPFNGSDLNQQSDALIQRFIISYAADPRVTLSLNGYVTSRPNGLLGVFGVTPPNSLNRPTTRLQLDTTFRF